MPIKPEDPCPCGNNDSVKFRQYRSSGGGLLGKYCKACDVEWLTWKHISSALRSAIDTPDASDDTELLFHNTPVVLEENKAFQIQSGRTKIKSSYFAEVLKPGDHITWHRPKGIWHHSIVSEILTEDNEIVVIHWYKKGHSIQIFEDHMSMNDDGNSLFNQMYRIDYPDEISQANITDLVLARARSRIGDAGYGLFSDNCESFATYCKTGSAKSHQVAWLEEKVKECCGLASVKSIVKTGIRLASNIKNGVPLAVSEVVPAEVIEEVLNGSQAIGAGIVILIETGFVIWDLSEAYAERKDSKISRRDFIEAATRRVVEGITSAGTAVACSIGLEIGIGCLFGIPFGPVGMVVGGIIGGLVGGIAGGAVGRAIGTWAGSFAGKVISRRFPDDKAVTNIKELRSGDHIVLNRWFLHPRCHAIVVEHNDEDKMSVIRNSHRRGVVEEWIQFEQPLYRVEYERGSCLDPEKVVENAKSKLGQERYNLATYNCKTFARECKTLDQV